MPHESFAEDTVSHRCEQLEIIIVINEHPTFITKRIAKGKDCSNDLYFFPQGKVIFDLKKYHDVQLCL